MEGSARPPLWLKRQGFASSCWSALHRRWIPHVFHRPGFEWDVGVHYVGQVHRRDSQPAALFDYLTEGRLSWNAMPEVYDRVDIDGLSFDYVSAKEQLRDALVRSFPHDQRAIDGYFKAISRCLRGLPLFYARRCCQRWWRRHWAAAFVRLSCVSRGTRRQRSLMTLV